MSDIIPVIDAHCHVFPDNIADKSRDAVRDFYELPMYTSGTAANLVNERKRVAEIDGRRYQIVRQLICAPAVTSHQSYSINSFISDLVHNDAALIGFGTVHPDNKDADEQLRRFREMGLCGLKLHSDFQRFDIDDKKAYPIYEEAAHLGVPVLFHMGDRRSEHSLPKRLRVVMNDFPQLTVVAAHTGGYSHWHEALDLLEPSDRLYFDISSTLQIIEEDLFKRFLNRFGVSHFFFGSDFPMWDPHSELKKLLSFGLPDDTIRSLLSDNFLNFYHMLNK